MAVPYREILATFPLERQREIKERAAQAMINDTTYATIDPAPESGLAWRVKKIHHLTGDENHGDHNVFVSVYQAGEMVRDGRVSIEWGWNGQKDSEKVPLVPCTKQHPLYCADIPIFPGQQIWLRVFDGKNTPSDTVRGIISSMPSDSTGNNEYHNSTAVTFEITIISPVIENPPTIPTTGMDYKAALIAVREILKGVGL